MGGRRCGKLDQRPLRDGAQPFHRGDVLAEGQQARAEPVVGADSFHCPDRRQLAQQPINRGAGQRGFRGQLRQTCAAERPQDLEQLERGLNHTWAGFRFSRHTVPSILHVAARRTAP